MIHHDILHTIKKDRQHESFIYPYYGRYSIAEVPSTILAHFGIHVGRPVLPSEISAKWSQECKRVLFFFVDGFGFDHFVDYEAELPFFHKVESRGDVYPLTSVFPSTTAAALTALHTNLTPQEHGLPEWTVYFEELDKIIHGTLHENEGEHGMLYSGKTVYQTLRENGIRPYVFMYGEYTSSAYSDLTQNGAEIVTFTEFEELFDKLARILENEREPSYFFVYWNHVDTVEHKFGPRSKEHLQALAMLSHLLEERLMKEISPEAAQDILLIVGSDHGQAGIRTGDIIYLNEYIDLEHNYLRSPSKKMVYPTGAPHDVFLHVDESRLHVTLEFLQHELGTRADILTTKEAVARGLFGLNQPSERFLKRIGDIVILPYEGYHIWYKNAPDFEWAQKGIHGGLSQAEMIVPLAVCRLADIVAP